MANRLCFFLLIVAVVYIETAAFAQEVKIPKLHRRSTDFTNTLTSQELDALETDLVRFEDSTSTQLVVVMIATLGAESIEDFSLRTVEANRVGQKERDNGVLLLVVKDDRKIRIEVGYGLEGVLPDALAGQIIRREITPAFRTGDYYSGIKAGINAIMLATRNEYKAEPKGKNKDFGWLGMLVFLAIIFFSMMRGSRRGLMSSVGLPLLLGSSLGGRHSGSRGGGFGGFSGGGGSFGGGGASGGW